MKKQSLVKGSLILVFASILAKFLQSHCEQQAEE